jgi:hypothetical protein
MHGVDVPTPMRNEPLVKGEKSTLDVPGLMRLSEIRHSARGYRHRIPQFHGFT